MIKVRFSPKFRKSFQKAPKDIKARFNEQIDVFLLNPMNPRLRNHALKGILLGFRSINISGDWRALYREDRRDRETVVIFEALGTHSQLYK